PAVAGFDRFFNHSACALAGRARLRDAENTARTDHLAAPAARRARFHARTRFRAGAVTDIAAFRLRDGDLLLATMRGFLEGDLHVVAQILAALRLRGIHPSAAE